jgi:hypothetical protein
MAVTPGERSAINRANVISSWSKTRDRAARTQAARDARLAAWADRVDPDHPITDPDERRRAARDARKAHMIRLGIKAARASRAKNRATS